MTASSLAEAADLTKGFISQVESGRSNPSVGSLARIARSLHVSLGDLLEEGSGSTGFPGLEALPKARTPRVSRALPPSADTSALQFVGNVDGVKRYIVALVPGAALVPHSSSRGGGGSCGVVVGGEVEFSQSPVHTLLSEGDVVMWEESRRYRFENKGETVARLFIELSERSALPVLVDRRPGGSERRQEIASYSSEGPLRLAAMRAKRYVKAGR